MLDLGSVWHFDVITPAARTWIEAHVDIPELLGSSVGFVADHRPGRQLAEVLAANGLTVRLS